MSWEPKYSNIVRETFDYYSANTGLQVIGNGSVYLLPQYTGARSYYSKWPLSPSWTFSDIYNYSGYNTGQYLSYTGSGNTNDFLNSENSYTISTTSGTYSYIALTTGSSAIMQNIQDKAVLEFRLRAESADNSNTGITSINGLGCFVRTTGYQEYIEFSETGVHFHYHPELDFSIDLSTRKTFRIGFSGDDLYFFADSIRGFVGANKFNQTAFHTNYSGALISFGTPYLSSIAGNLSGFSGSLFLDYLKIYTGFFELDETYISPVSYTTIPQVAFTDYISYPNKLIALDFASVFHTGDYGKTSVSLERRATINDSWSVLNTTIISGQSPYNIDLSDVIPLKNNTEQYRFQISQESQDGINPPRQIEEIVFSASFEENNLVSAPTWGPSYGQNIVSLALDRTNWEKYPAPIDSSGTIFLLDTFSSQTFLFEEHSGYSGNLNGTIEVLSDLSKIKNFYKTSTGSIINSTMSDPYINAGPDISQYTSSGLPTGLSGGIYGQIATGNYYVVTGQRYDDIYLSKYIRYDQSGIIDSAQYVYCNTTGVGFGVTLTGTTNNALYLFKGDIQLADNSNVYIKHSSNQWNLSSIDYIQNNKFGIVFTSTGTSNSVEILSANPESAFILDNIELYQISGGHYSFSSQVNYPKIVDSTGRRYENFYIDTKFKLDGTPSNEMYLLRSSTSTSFPLNSGCLLSINKDRLPVFSIAYNYGYINGNSSTVNGTYVSITGSKTIPINEDIYLSAGIYTNTFSGLLNNANIYLTYNGQVIGIKNFDLLEDLNYIVSGLTPVIKPCSGTTIVVSGGALELDYIRMQSLECSNPEHTSREFAHIGQPYFRSDYWYEPSGSNYIMLRGSNDGGLVSDSPNQMPFFVNHPDGWITFENIGTYGLVNAFNKTYSGNARTYIPSNIKSELTGTSGSFAFGTWLSWDGISGTLFGIGNPSLNHGFNIDLDNYGNLIFNKIIGGTTEVFSFNNIGTGVYDVNVFGFSGYIIDDRINTHIGLVLNNTGNNYMLSFYKNGERLINNYSIFTGINPLSYVSGNSGGWIYSLASAYDNSNFINVSLEETWFDSNYQNYTGSGIWETLYSGSLDKSVSRDKVYVNYNELAVNKIASPNRNQKYIVMPSGSGEVPISCGINNHVYGGETGKFGSLMYSKELYKYVPMYNFDLSGSELPEIFGGKNSVFTILNSVPNDSLNLAYISTESFDTNNGLSFIDLSYKEIQNVSNYKFGEYQIDLSSSGTSGTVTGKKWVYSGEVDNDDIAISAQIYSDKYLNVGDYLYYYHLVGNGKYTVLSKTSNILDIKSSIKLIDSRNNLIDPVSFPWDIKAVNTDIDGITLPSGESYVFILTKYPYIKDSTIWIEYNAGLPSNSKQLFGYKEILNPSKIYKESEDYSLTYLSGNWTLSIDNITSVDSNS